MDCMRRVIGAHKSASHVGILVRMGVFPLQYEFVYRAILWYLKIHNNESDPVLTEQLRRMRADDTTFSLTCFYRHSHAYIKKLSTLSGVNLFSCSTSERKSSVRAAMFQELSLYWGSLSQARVLRSIHPKWEQGRLSSVMNTRYTCCLMHNLALARGPLRWTIHRRHAKELQLCRHGCGEIENLNHLVFDCKKLKRNRRLWKKRCKKENLEFNLKSLLRAPELRDEFEQALVVFFNIT